MTEHSQGTKYQSTLEQPQFRSVVAVVMTIYVTIRYAIFIFGKR